MFWMMVLLKLAHTLSGIMMPGKIQIAMGPMVLEGEVKSFKLNEKLSLDAFK
jgi:hypothetical protein